MGKRRSERKYLCHTMTPTRHGEPIRRSDQLGRVHDAIQDKRDVEDLVEGLLTKAMNDADGGPFSMRTLWLAAGELEWALQAALTMLAPALQRSACRHE
jgi:hypothetical protein